MASVDDGSVEDELNQPSNIEDISTRHRKERKELQAKIQALKKNAPKKKRKEVIEEIVRLETELERRQAQQLNNLNDINNKNKLSIQSELKPKDEYLSNAEESKEEPQRISKAQKRRDKKALDAKLRDAEILAMAEDNKNSSKVIELRDIQKILKDRKLSLYMIATDGDCLYNAVKHQLELIGHGFYSVSRLREITANYILDNKDSLICYMTNPNTGELLTDDDFLEYCEKVRNTPAWGGQIELKALSCALKVPIEVLQAAGPPTIHRSDDDFSPINLTITYHRHMYSLGEHYNSTQPKVENTDDDDKDDEASFKSA